MGSGQMTYLRGIAAKRDNEEEKTRHLIDLTAHNPLTLVHVHFLGLEMCDSERS